MPAEGGKWREFINRDLWILVQSGNGVGENTLHVLPKCNTLLLLKFMQNYSVMFQFFSLNSRHCYSVCSLKEISHGFSNFKNLAYKGSSFVIRVNVLHP